jgi:hypothetical protein
LYLVVEMPVIFHHCRTRREKPLEESNDASIKPSKTTEKGKTTEKLEKKVGLIKQDIRTTQGSSKIIVKISQFKNILKHL